MAEYLGTVYLGGLYNNGNIMSRPTKPWRNDLGFGYDGIGNIPSMIGSMANYSIGDTPSSEANKLKWHKIKDGNKTLFICDRNLLLEVSWNDLNAQNLVSGKTIKIDGQEYKVRLLTGGNNYRNEKNCFEGGSPTSNEWDRFITREEVVSDLPVPVNSDLDNALNDIDATSKHNQFWNWGEVHSLCQENHKGGELWYCSGRGGSSARQYSYVTKSMRSKIVGWRPVLEQLNTAPLISDLDRDLGDKNANFSISYTVDDKDVTDILTVTESIDGTVKKTINSAIRNQVYTINVNVNELSIGSHTITINVIDGKGGIATRVFTFRRTNAAPTISGNNANLGDKNIGFQIKYTVNDSDGDSLTVTEKLGTEILRTINNAPKGQELTIDITSEKLYTLGLNSVNTITIEVSDGKGGFAYRTYTFKRTNTAPTISGIDMNLGIMTGSFSKNYTVSDVEGDIVVVTEKIDDEIIRSYSAVLGAEQTITLSQDIWHRLTNGNHSLKIEAVDGNFATSIRVFGFTKDERRIIFELATPFVTDEKARKILVTPTWKIEGADIKVEACNNAYDDVPTWEDITAQVIINRVYNFTNEVKTAQDWGVNIRFTIIKNEGYTGEVNISGLGGAYE